LCSHKHKTDETSKLAASFQEGAKAETETAGTSTSEGAIESL